VWGAFRVPNDPGRAPVAVPGVVRVPLEALFFGGATWALYTAGRETWGWILGVIVLLHYAVSYDRVLKPIRK
jgi:hypothetical protein